MAPLKSKQIGEPIEFANATQKTTMLYKDTGTININDMEKIIQSFNRVAKNKKQNTKVTRIFVVAGDKKATWNDIDEFMEYYEGRVKDADKFHEFFQVYITTATSN